MLRKFTSALLVLAFVFSSLPLVASSSDPSPLFSDSFSGSLSQWEVATGTWSIEDGQLSGTGAGPDIDGWIYAGNTAWTDYALSAKVYFGEGNAELVLRSTGHWQNEYRIEVYNSESPAYTNRVGIARYRDGNYEPLVSALYSPVQITNPADVRAEIAGNTIALFVNGSLVVSVEDPAPLPAGRFGLGVIWGWHCHFDDVVVTPISSTAPASTATPQATATPSPMPTATATATATSSPTPTSTATATSSAAVTPAASVPPTQAQIPDVEYQALVALYNSTGGPNWTVRTGWLETDTPCSWYGVSCSYGRVNRIELPGNELSGTIPPELGRLSMLERLNLSVNRLTGAIPPELGNLANLSYLSLLGNQLTGSIPSELGNLAELRYVSLSSNQLTGAIPPELGNLANVRELSLFQNQLTGPIPPELGNLANLEYLYLFGNQLTGAIPPELGNLSRLLHLHLERNSLTGAIPPQLGNLANLWILSAHSNSLTGAIPAELGNLANLQELSLAGNRLTGSIPPELGNLAALKILSLDSNELTGRVPPELGNLVNLHALSLGNNQLSGPLPHDLTNLALRYFSFDNTDLCEPGDPAFQAWLRSIWSVRTTNVICSVWVCPTGDCGHPGYEYSSIQAAVDAAVPHSTVNVAAGTYVEQVRIQNKSLNLIGAGQGATIIRPPDTLQTLFQAGAQGLVVDAAPVVYVCGQPGGTTTNVTLQHLTVDGNNRLDPTREMFGIAFNLAGGTVDDVAIVNVRSLTETTEPRGTALVAYNWDGVSRSLAITNNTIRAYQKTGILLEGQGLAATVSGNTVDGPGDAVPNASPYGIWVGEGAQATITGNTVTGNRCTDGNRGPDILNQAQATGIYLQGSGFGSSALGNTVSGNNLGIVGTGTTMIDDNIVRDNLAAGLYLENGQHTVRNNAITGGNIGVCILSNTGPVWMQGNAISSAGIGVQVFGVDPSDGATGGIVVRGNSIQGCATGVANSASGTVDAKLNWWGVRSGPTHSSNPGGGGPAVSGNVSFSPWLGDGTDTVPYQPGFQGNLGLRYGIASELAFAVLPAGGVPGELLSPQPVVQARDAEGNLAINFRGPVTLTLQPNPSGAMLTGTTTRNASDGVAAFSDIAVDQAGTGYVLQASAEGMAQVATSAPFDVLPPPQVVYVDANWWWVSRGEDPDGAGPATSLGYDAFVRVSEAVKAVAAGGTVNVAPGSYPGSLVIEKPLTLQGQGSGEDWRSNTVITAAWPNDCIIGVKAGGTSAADRLVIRNLRLANAIGNGSPAIWLTEHASHLTIDNVAMVGNAGPGLVMGATGTITDVVVNNCLFANNLSGLSVGPGGAVVGLSITNSRFEGNACYGLNVAGHGGTTDLTVADTTFVGNGAAGVMAQSSANISLWGYNGSATLRNVTIDASQALYGIVINGEWQEPARPLGALSFSNVRVTGSPVLQAGVSIGHYSDASGLSIDGLEVNIDLMPGLDPWGNRHAALLMVDLSSPSPIVLRNTSFGGSRGSAEVAGEAAYDLVASLADVDATGVTFSSADDFAIEDLVHHRLDQEWLGLVMRSQDEVWVTPRSGSLQRGVNAVAAGGTVHVAPGYYYEPMMTIKKPVTLRSAAGSDSTFIYNTSGSPSVIVVASSSVTIEGFTLSGGTGVAGVHRPALYARSEDGSQLSGITVRNCRFAPWDMQAIALHNVANCKLENNTFEVYLSPGSESPGAALEIAEVAGLTATGNRFSGDTDGVEVLGAGDGFGDSTGVRLFNNSFTELAGQAIRNEATSLVDASGNWWGTSSAAVMTATVGANVDYTPWLDSGADVSSDTGFQGDFSTVWADANSPQAGTEHPVQEAIDLVTSPGVVRLAPGTYAGGIVVDKPGVTLIGSDGTVIGYGSPAVTIAADNVTVSQIRAEGTGAGAGTAGIVVRSGVANPVIQSCEVARWPADGIVFEGSVISPTLSGNAIEENAGNAILFQGEVVAPTLTENVIADNTGDAILFAAAVTDPTVTGNSVTGNTGGGITFTQPPVGEVTISGNEGWLRLTASATPNPAPVGTEISLVAAVGDGAAGSPKIISAEYSLDGTDTWLAMVPRDGGFDSSREEVMASLGSYASARVIQVWVRGADAAGNTTTPQCVLVAIYDPAAGYVTGGGWIVSPPGAYTPDNPSDPDVTGRADFAFVSRYKKGATVPTGQTEFQFRAGNLNFHSENYDWLVVAGTKAQYKGTGTINGAGEYGFMLTAIDGDLKGREPDKFRIKIWDKATGTIVYDNQAGAGDTADPATTLGGGNIVIHP